MKETSEEDAKRREIYSIRNYMVKPLIDFQLSKKPKTIKQLFEILQDLETKHNEKIIDMERDLSYKYPKSHTTLDLSRTQAERARFEFMYEVQKQIINMLMRYIDEKK